MRINEIKRVYALLGKDYEYNPNPIPETYIIETINGEKFSVPYNDKLTNVLFENGLIVLENIIAPNSAKYTELIETDSYSQDFILEPNGVPEFGGESDIFEFGGESDTSEPSEGEEGLSGEDFVHADNNKKAIAGIAGAAFVTLGVAAATAACGVTNTKDNNVEKPQPETTVTMTDSTVVTSLESFAVDNPFRVFYETAFDTLTTLNNYALNEQIFMLEEDKEEKAVLQFSLDEIISAMLAVNNYSEEELYEIFGFQELNSEKLMSNYQNFAVKMRIYMMNAKRASGISKLITDEGNRTWFETIEKTIIDFNNDLSNKNADMVIRTFAYFYSHNLNGVDNIKNDETTINCIKNLMLNMVHGYSNANSQEEYLTYLTVSSTPSDYDAKLVGNEASQVQKGETLKFYLDNAESGVCSLSVVQEHFNMSISRLNAKQQLRKNIEQQLLFELRTTLIANNEVELANSILDGISKEEDKLLQNSSCKETYENYKKQLESLNRDNRNIIIQTLQQKLNDTIQKRLVEIFSKENLGNVRENDFTLLYNNRVRGKENIKIVEENIKTGGNSSDSYYTKTPVATTTTTVTEQVLKNDLTPGELEEAEDQEEEIAKNNETVVKLEDGDTYSGVEAKATKDAIVWFGTFQYSHTQIINSINPEYPSVVPTDGSLENVVAAKYAFENIKITASDSQIQAQLSAAVQSFAKTTSDQNLINTYRNAWLSTIEDLLNKSYQTGLEIRQQAEQQKEAIERKNEEQSTEAPSNPENTDNGSSGLEEGVVIETPVESSGNTDNNSSSLEEEGVTETPVENLENSTDGGYVAETQDPQLAPPLDSVDGFEDIADPNYNGDDTRNGYVATTEEPTNAGSKDFHAFTDEELAAYLFGETTIEKSSVLTKK